MVLKVTRCGICDELGHNARTCPKKRPIMIVDGETQRQETKEETQARIEELKAATKANKKKRHLEQMKDAIDEESESEVCFKCQHKSIISYIEVDT